MKTLTTFLIFSIFFDLNLIAQRTSPQIAAKPSIIIISPPNSNSGPIKYNPISIQKQVMAVEKVIAKNKVAYQKSSVSNNLKTSVKSPSVAQQNNNKNISNEVSKQTNAKSQEIVVPVETKKNNAGVPIQAIQRPNENQDNYTFVRIKRRYDCAILQNAYFAADPDFGYTPIPNNIQDQIDAINIAVVNNNSPYKVISIKMDPAKINDQKYVCLNWNLAGCVTEKAQLDAQNKELRQYDFWDIGRDKFHDE